jgi:kynureninase
MKHDPELWRDRFPILDSTTYLVNHSLGAMPAAVVDKLRAFTDAWATRSTSGTSSVASLTRRRAPSSCTRTYR